MEEKILVRVGADITQFSRAMADANKSLTKFTDSNKETFDSFKQVGAAVTGAGVAIGAGLGAAVKSAITFESAFAGVRKTLDASEAEFAELGRGIRDMAKELPASVNEIAAVAESAGQLGIAKEDVLAFTRTMIDLGETTNMTSEDAATQLARFANITGMSMDTISNLGSTIVDLGNNSATTEGEIVALGMRIAAAGSQAKMTEAEIMAISASASSLGVEAEAGGTALSMLFTKMTNAVDKGGKSLDSYAKASGMTAKQFADAWKNDPTTALNALLQGLDKSAKSGENMSGILDELGIKGAREVDVVNRMAAGHELVAESIQTANKAWKEDSALSEEAAQRYATTEAELRKLRNMVNEAGISIGHALIPAIQALTSFLKDLVERFNGLSESTKTFIAIGAAVASAMMLIVGPILMLIGFIPQIISGFGAVMSVLKGAVAAFNTVRTVLLAVTGPIGWVVAAVIALAFVVYKYWDEIKAYTISAWGTISAFFTQLWMDIKQVAVDTWASIAGFFTGLWDSIETVATIAWAGFTAMLTSVWESIKSVAQTVWGAVVTVIMAVIQPIINSVTNVFNGMKDGLVKIFDGVKQYFGGVWDLIKNIFLGAILLIVDLVTGNFDDLKTDSIAIFNNIKDALNDIWEGIKKIFSGAGQAIVGYVKATWENIKSNTSAVWNGIKSLLKTSWNGIKDTSKSVFESVKSTINSIWNGIKTFFTETLTNIVADVKRKFDEFKASIVERMAAAVKVIKTAWDGAMTFLRGIDLKQIGADIINGLINGIKSKVKEVGDAVKNVTDAITGKIRDILDIRSPSRVMASIGEFIGEGLAKGIGATKNLVGKSTEDLAKAAIPNVASINLSDSFIEDVDTLNDVAIAKLETFKSAVLGIMENLSNEWSEKLVNLRVRTLIELGVMKRDMQQIGVASMEGLINGLESKRSALISKAISIADALKSAMANAFNINSPSRWMRDFIGKNMMLGWIDGMNAMQAQVVRKAEEAADWMKPEMPRLTAYQTPSLSGISTSSVRLHSDSTGMVGGITQNLTVITPEPTSPSENARKMKQAARELAYEWGV